MSKELENTSKEGRGRVIVTCCLGIALHERSRTVSSVTDRDMNLVPPKYEPLYCAVCSDSVSGMSECPTAEGISKVPRPYDVTIAIPSAEVN